jgi:D-alanyl-D-alanine carboxypeptidase (penicillin-binding protein 5/6)
VSPPHRRRSAATAALLSLALTAALASTGLGAGGGPPPPPPRPPPRAPASAIPDVTAPVAALADLDSGQILVGNDVDAPRPIASVTKIMTALIVLARTKPDDAVVVSPDAAFHPHDYGASSTIGLEAGERLTVSELLRGMLLGSANDAAVALAIHVSGSSATFVDLMNRRAQEMGLRHTVFYSSNGLDDRGHSTARDLVALTRVAMRTPGFAGVARMKTTTLPAPDGDTRHIQNRNALLWLYHGATGVKTGYTAAAGYCLVASAERDGRRLLAVVLGAPNDAFSDAASLLDYGFAAFEPHTFVRKGDALGNLPIVGGTVPVVAGASLHRLVPSRSLAGAASAVQADPAAAFPPAPGQRVGTLTVTIPGAPSLTVPVLAGALPPPEPSNVPWWARAAGAIGRAVGGVVSGLTS